VFEGNPVAYEFAELDELVHAFACSTHKSQGSEYPVVVLVLLPAHYMLLQRNLLYTGVTRARKLCVIVGSKRAIGMAVRNDRVARRYSGLAARLASGGGPQRRQRPGRAAQPEGGSGYSQWRRSACPLLAPTPKPSAPVIHHHHGRMFPQ
jgi:hypothetical protein